MTSYLARFPFRDVVDRLPQTPMSRRTHAFYALSGALSAGSLLIAAIAVAAVFVDRRTVAGYELRMRGKNPRFAGYGGVALERQAIGTMFAAARSLASSARLWCSARGFALSTARC